MKEKMGVALWSVNLSHPVASIDAWADMVDRKIAEAKKSGAEILLMPEYAAEQWLHFAPTGLKAAEQPAWMASHVPAALLRMKDLARQRQILLIPGTFPTPFEGRPSAIGNRAHIFFPDGRVLTQNKLCLTPREKSPSGWMMSAGDELAIFEWRGFKVAVMVCLDIELPALSAKIAQEKIDLILVPSMTKKLAGYHRVFDCAKARAIELQAAIAVTGAIGGGPGREPNIAGASIFLPCEEKLGHTGLLAQITPSYTAEGEGPLLTAEIPLSDIRTLRQGQAEVWPGAWAADHVKICRSA